MYGGNMADKTITPRDGEYDICYCCQVRIAKNDTEFHHFPVSKNDGGNLVVPMCLTCHNHVDRFRMCNWDINTWVNGFNDLTSTREGRLFFMKICKIFGQKICEI
jgi:hypothetical protein